MPVFLAGMEVQARVTVGAQDGFHTRGLLLNRRRGIFRQFFLVLIGALHFQFVEQN